MESSSLYVSLALFKTRHAFSAASIASRSTFRATGFVKRTSPGPIRGDVSQLDVKSAIDEATLRLSSLGVLWGSMSLVLRVAKGYFAKRTSLLAVGMDLSLLADAVKALRSEFSG